jgi:CRISPR-associated protein Csx14
MAESKIPVDLFNPGQVFACLGFMELADVLLGDAEAGFDWSDSEQTQFCLTVAGDDKPVDTVLEFLANASIVPVTPIGYVPKMPAKSDEDDDDEDGDEADAESDVALSEIFPAKEGDTTALPVRLLVPEKPAIEVSHWADGSSRNTFKLYSGNRSAEKVARAMLNGVRNKLTAAQKKKGHTIGVLKYKGIEQLWSEKKEELIAEPFDVLTAVGGSFNFDPRGAWTALDAGYSPNTQKHGVMASPLVHLLAACGLEHTRPVESGVRQVRYAIWKGLLPPALARVAFQGGIPSLPMRHFYFELALSGKNKVVTFAQQENI